MQNITRIALGLGAAAVVASGGSAFTAGLTAAPGNGETLGYGAATVTGATLTNIAYNTVAATVSDPADSSRLQDVTFTVNGRVKDYTDNGGQEHNYDIKLALNDTATLSDCPTASRTWNSGSSTTTVVCPVSVAITAVNGVHLTVTPK